MIPLIVTKIRLNKMITSKSCKINCKCKDRIKILLTKTPVNIIDEAFIMFQLKEQESEYNKCYSNKLK